MRYCYPLRCNELKAFCPVRSFLFITVLFLFTCSFATAQNSFTYSLVFIRVNEDNEDAFSFLILRELPAGEQVYVTDEGWNGNSWVGNSEDHLIYTSPGLLAGDIVHVEEAPSGTSFIVTGAGGTLVYASGSSGFSLSSGDQLLAYLSDDGPEPDNPIFLTGIHLDDGKDIAGGINQATGWSNQDYLDAGGSSVSASAVPLMLTTGVNCVALFPDPETEKDNAIYDCSNGTKGTRKELMQKICNKAYWLGQNSPRYSENQVCNFIVLGSPEIQVFGNGNQIVNGDFNPEANDFTDFGGIELGSGAVTHSFSVKNSGDTLLNLVSISLSDATNFRLKNPVPQTVLPDGSASFEIEFDPHSKGTYTSDVTITSNDEENRIFQFRIKGSCVDVQPPSVQAGMLNALTTYATSATLNWNRGNGDAVAVFIAKENPLVEVPDNNTSYAADSVLGIGSPIGGSDWFCVFNGTGDSAAIGGLFPGTAYSIVAFEYNEESGLIKYNQLVSGSNNSNFQTTSILINEVDTDTPGADEMEFIELFDGGMGNTKLDGLTLVGFNGSSDESYFSFDLEGYKTNQNGYFVLGSPGMPVTNAVMANSTLQNGADAIGLFAAVDSDFPNGTLVTENRLVDAMVYDTNDLDDPGLLVLLNPGEPQINEGEENKDLYSIQRIPNGSGGARNTSTYLTDYPTPGNENKRSSRILVFGNGVQITNGDTVPDISDFTDFGIAEVNFQTVIKSFKIVNRGQGVLNIINSPAILLSGTQAAGFVVTQNPPSEIAPGDSAFFEISFSPIFIGSDSAIVSIASDDPENPIFDFSVQGTGIFTANVIKEDIRCFGESSGQVFAIPTNGTGNFTFEWSTGRVVQNVAADTLSNLVNGTYSVIITDQYLNVFTDTVEIVEPSELAAEIIKKRNVDCVGDNSGTLTVSTSGGVPPYLVVWSDGQKTVTAKNLREGDYWVTVTDAHGCETILLDSITVTDSIKPIAICKDTTLFLDQNGSVRIHARDISGASWDNCEIGVRGLNHSLFECCDIGINEVIATIGDHNGNISQCTSSVTIVDTIPPKFDCFDLLAYADSSGWINLSSGEFLSGLNDNCGIGTIEPDSFHIEFASINMEIELWINEFHYDNSGTDENEFIEIAGKAGTQLNGYEIILYNGSDGTSYRHIPLSGTIPDEIAGFGALVFYISGIQNGSADGIVLISPNADVIEFISYEGQFEATDDLAEGLLSTDVGFEENSNAAINSSIQKITDSNWLVSEESSPGSLNQGQFLPDPGTLNLNISVVDINGNEAVCQPKLTIIDSMAPIALCHDTTLFLDSNGMVEISAESLNAGSSDNSGTFQIELSKTLFDCEDVGNNTIIFSVSDRSGNISTCESDVLVLDTISPIALCSDTILYLDVNGDTKISAEVIDSGSYDNCAVAEISISKDMFSCENVSENVVTLNVADYSENVATCRAKVLVEDTIPPTALCNDLKLYLDENGSAELYSDLLDAGSFDNCGIASFEVSEQNFDCTNLGLHKVKLIVSDFNGNIAECYSSIEISDTVKPETICIDTTIYLDNKGAASIFPELIVEGSSDNCTINSLFLDKSEFTCADLGLNSVLLTVSDSQGNIASCESEVTVADTIHPFVVCHDTVLFLNRQGMASITAAMLDAGSFDNCSIAGLTLNKTEYFCKDIGENLVQLTSIDVSGNSEFCQLVVSVLDTIPPEIVCSDTVLYLDKNGRMALSSSDLVISTNDNCETFSVYPDSLFFGCNSLVEPTITSEGRLPEIIVSDLSGNVATSYPHIKVQDTIQPEALCRDLNVYLDQNGLAEITPEMINAGSIDNCNIINFELSQHLFTSKNMGVNDITLKVEDMSGNVATCISKVNISDTLAPVAACRDTILLLDESGQAIVKAQCLNKESSDNCAIASYSISQDTFSCIDIGANDIVFSVTDSSGNLDSCISTIFIKDRISPVFQPVNDIVVDATAGACSALIDYPEIVADDNCFAEIKQISGLGQRSRFPEGATTEVFLAEDASGNFDTLSFNVIVNHTNAPPTVAQIPDFAIAEDSTLCFCIEGISDGDSCVKQEINFSIHCLNLFDDAEISTDFNACDSLADITIGFMSDWFGESLFQVSVEDCEGATINRNFTVNVMPVNDSPVLLTPFPDFEVQATQTLSIPISPKPGVIFDDVDDDSISFELQVNKNLIFPEYIDYTNDTLYLSPSVSDTGIVEVTLVAKDFSGASATDTFLIKILEYKTGVEQLRLEALHIYPNPTNGLLYVNISSRLLEMNPKLLIFSEEGKTIFTGKISGLSTQINLNGFTNGVYYLRLEMNENTIFRKIILNQNKMNEPE